MVKNTVGLNKTGESVWKFVVTKALSEEMI
jgi:hypothetical protein